MRSIKRSSWAFIILLLSSANAFATCTQADGAGTWKAFSLGFDDSGTYWLRCSVPISSAGNIITGSSAYCINASGQKGFFGTGRVTVASSCAVTASLLLDGTRNTIVDGQMTRDKESFTGVGKFSGGIFHFTAVKK